MKDETICNMKELEESIQNVLSMLEKERLERPGSMVELLMKRYQTALVLVRKSQDASDIESSDLKVIGGARAFLDSSSDYHHPVLEEMYKVEKIIKRCNGDDARRLYGEK
ncbi:hypothetical protein P6709_10025 [Jeotgalibacillus sp. ET6]|uniref:hypothetical protein n=1 Tax=Jeotgalibacillus sp. ET6 TaxID=3037260 RepID=UPI00241823D4|nr:hypothetical protein [Jeotgalibacillus sp. ET6]MDG5472089.1 hypothetical protein [Jeotgalibacillus sp. ET6]